MQTFTSISSKIPVAFVSFQGAGHGVAQTGIKAVTDPAVVIDQVLVTNADSAIARLTLYLYRAGTYYPFGSCNVPIGAGTLGAPSFDVLAAALPTAFGSLILQGTDGLAWALDANLVAGQMTVIAYGGFI